MRSEQELLRLCELEKPVGGNVVLFNDKEILYSFNYGYADHENGIESTNDSLYMIGSNTKIMTSLGIFSLFEKGELSLEDDIRKFIPEFEVKATFEYDKITIGNLLMHRSGLTSDLFPMILEPGRDYHEVVEVLKDTYLSSVPGEMFSYSNLGYTLLGIIIERISGLSYPDYIQRTIGDPLGIHIYFLATPEEREKHASEISWCYDPAGKRMEDALQNLLPAGSNTYISLNDFVKFGQIFLNKDHTILKRETLELMEQLGVTEEIDHSLTNVGYGLFHNQHDYGEKVGKILGHTGNTICHHSMFHYIPKQNIAVFAVTNSLQTTLMTTKMGMTVLTEYLQDQGLLTDGFPQYTYTDADGERYIGKYSTLLGMIEIVRNEKQELCTTIMGCNYQLRLCKDGYVHCIPEQETPNKSMRLLLTTYAGKEVLIKEDRDGYDRVAAIIGARYEEIEILDAFREACGDYEAASPFFKNLVGDAYLRLEDGNKLRMQASMTGMLLQGYLKPVSETLAFAQGYGRNSRQALTLKKDDDEIYMTYAGITLRKK